MRSTISSDSQDAAATLVFSDDAKTSGIQFLYEDAAIAGSDTTRLFEFTGGGVAALDADLDGWPDVFLTQGGNAPALGNLTHSRVSASQASPADQLFRNLRGQTFRTVTESAKLIDGGENLIEEQDRLFAGDGEGGFADITESVGTRAKDGLGLGLVVLRLGDDHGLSVFVANDARPNFLFVNRLEADQQDDALHPLERRWSSGFCRLEHSIARTVSNQSNDRYRPLSRTPPDRRSIAEASCWCRNSCDYGKRRP